MTFIFSYLAAGISLGWGKKETQFHGSEGKSSAQKKVDMSGFTLSDYDDDLKPRVSWCGDGNMFCCSIIDQNKGDFDWLFFFLKQIL